MVSRKLSRKWEGGWNIAEIKSPVNMMIKNKEGNMRVVHINQLQLRILRNDSLRSNSIPEAYNQPFNGDERTVSRRLSSSDRYEKEVSKDSILQKPNDSWETNVDNTLTIREQSTRSIREIKQYLSQRRRFKLKFGGQDYHLLHTSISNLKC